MPKLNRIDSAPLHERVYQELRRALMAGLYPVGQTFSLAQIAGELGTSVMPVREALNRLSAEQAVNILPKRGVVLPEISDRKYRELVKVRIMLEGMAAELATDMITAADISALEAIAARMEEVTAVQNRWQEYNLLNHDFHFTIYRAGQPEVILPLIETLWLQTGPLLNIYQHHGTLPAGNRHRLILDALIARDPVTTREAIRNDILAGYSYISAAFGWPVPDDYIRHLSDC